MGVLTRILAALAWLWATAASATPLDRWEPYVAEASRRFAVPSDWIRRVIQVESAGRARIAGRPIVSRAGAMGLMQLMPGTWRDMRATLMLGPDPHDPRDNILAGTLYLRLLYDRFGFPGLFAAYNAGPARYAAALAGRSQLPAETRSYLARVTGTDRRIVARSVPPAPGIFIAPSRPQASAHLRRSTDPLFAINVQLER